MSTTAPRTDERPLIGQLPDLTRKPAAPGVFRKSGQRGEHQEIDHGAGRLDHALDAGAGRRGRRWLRRRARCGLRGCVGRRSGDERLRGPAAVARVEVIARDGFGRHRCVEVGHPAREHQRVAIGRALDLDRRVDALQGAAQHAEITLDGEGKLARRAVGKPDDERRATGFTAQHQHSRRSRLARSSASVGRLCSASAK